ncbi:SDR family NAD(P)-dependent oxidoreductase [Wenzhouxiangella sediminis]|uniref:SDR family NAD(P)-dependent oxidoreductase n=1 Tax=Wenzhouxiangella sediminis TaxID=1792836 RepID=A0A3E1K774_9GAMM|nr:SDR family NAD(P)-dependent oxidoreductase [Wenzhouxiangella sediminis]RFF29809.1 SDR family NAD(P)-dependent oxidoreductase [Wenzhouxiangella sediminis]
MIEPKDAKPFPAEGVAVVAGASGGIGAALRAQLESHSDRLRVIGLSRRGDPPLDVTDEDSIRAAAEWVDREAGEVRLVIDATGFLHNDEFGPEKTWSQLDPDHLAKAFAVNASGPALLMKHFLPLLPKKGKSVFATLSARVGSIGDNRLGGWYSYRASKAALNQFVRTASIELRRSAKDAVCVALHPGTVDTGLSAPFGKQGLKVRAPDIAARELLAVISDLEAADSGAFLDYRGETVPW